MISRYLFKTIVRYFFLLIGSIFISELIVAQEVITISESGKEVKIPDDLRNQFINESTGVGAALKTWYSSSGYFNASITKISSHQYNVEKGCRFSVKDVFLSDSDTLPIDKIKDKFYSDDLIKNFIEEVLRVFEEKGYLFSKVEITSLSLDQESCGVYVDLQIDKGNTFFSSEVLFPGASANSPEYLRNISGFRDSALITSKILSEFRSNLVQSELFEEVAFPEVFLEEDDAVIVIAVRERTLNQFDGLLGYVPDQNGNGQIVGDFELSLWNVLNQGNGINLQYQRLRPETTRLNIGVSQDWFGSLPVGVGFNFNLYQNDTTYQTRNIGLDAYYLVKRGLKLTGGIGQVTSVSSNSSLLTSEPTGKKRYAELGFQFTSVDNFEVPTRGVRFRVKFGIANKSVDIDSVKVFSQPFIESRASYFIPLFSKSVLAISSEAFLLNSDKTTESDLFRFGGANSFRGYAEEQFRASQLIWGDIEYRFLLNRSSYLFTFVASGAYFRPQLITESDNSFKTSGFLYSTGFGISYKIKIGRLKFAYAVSPDESFGNGKIHLGIITNL